MLWNYGKGYDNSLSWSVTTTADIIEFPAWTMNNGLMEHQIMGEKYLLQERYSGSRIERNLLADQVYLGLTWLGLCLFLALSTSFSRYFFFAVMAGLALMINRLNLFEVGLFGIESKMVMVIPFALFVIPLVYFHEYRKDTPLIIRLSVLILISTIIGFGINNPATFTDHFIAHSLFSFAIFGLLFIFLVSEEIIFLFLYAVTSTKGGKSNHLHFLLLSIIYLGNLTLYYLNKSGIYENSFSFFDPYILLLISTLIALWSIKHKEQPLSSLIPQGVLPFVMVSLGVITFGFLSLSMQRGMDSVYQSFHYFVLYAHLGFGVLFLLYIIANFIDPLIKGLEVFKIAYRERNFPYITARLGGLVAVMTFFFLSGQEPYNLLKSGYYSYLSVKEKNLGNDLLDKEYLINAEFLGFNTHFPNYSLAWREWDNGNEFRTKSNFFNATQRYPSDYAWVNYGNLVAKENPNKVQAVYEESLRKMNSSEMKNNLGIIHLGKGEANKALDFFNSIEASNDWNQAPLVNKWNALNQIRITDSANYQKEYEAGNFGVKANIIANSGDYEKIDFQCIDLQSSAPLHKQAYLVNSLYGFDHDSLENFVRKEMDQTTSGSAYDQLAKALGLYLYQKKEVNKAFKVLDELQGNTNEVYKGEYLDVLGKLALDQGAYRLAQDFFTQAIRSGYETSRISRLEAFAGQNKKETITNELIKILERDPSLTNEANRLLEQIETFTPQPKSSGKYKLDSMGTERIVSLANQNAFHESLIIDAVDELDKRDSVMLSYDILVEAIEINLYSIPLLKRYILTAIEWNLNDYADQSMEKLKGLISDEDLNEFSELVAQRKEELEEEEW